MGAAPTSWAAAGGALTTAASLLATAALHDAAGPATVSVTVTGTDISVQVPRHAGDRTARTAAVTAYARILHTPVTQRPRPASADMWVETHGVMRRQVHVWTLIHAQER